MKINTYQITTLRPASEQAKNDLCDLLGVIHLKYGSADVITKKLEPVTKTELKARRHSIIGGFKFYDLASDCWRTGMMDASTRQFYEYAGKL